MDPELEKELKKLRADVSALVTLLPAVQRVVVKPVVERMLGVLDRIAARL